MSLLTPLSLWIDHSKRNRQRRLLAIAEDLVGGLRKDSYVSTAEYHFRDLQAFVAWYNPYSGEAACHVYIYTYDAKKQTWERKLASIFRKTQDVSVEFDSGVILLRDIKGNVIQRYPKE